jgi:hypothetical protein
MMLVTRAIPDDLELPAGLVVRRYFEWLVAQGSTLGPGIAEWISDLTSGPYAEDTLWFDTMSLQAYAFEGLAELNSEKVEEAHRRLTQARELFLALLDTEEEVPLAPDEVIRCGHWLQGNRCLRFDGEVQTYSYKGRARVALVETLRSKKPILVVDYRNRKYCTGVLVENVIDYWLRKTPWSVIPFFGLVDDAVLAGFLTRLSRVIPAAVFSGNRLSSAFASDYLTLVGASLTAFDEMLILGHDAEGLIAKGLGLLNSQTTSAWETPMMGRSPVDAMFSGSSFPERAYSVSNYFSGTTLISMPDMLAKLNLEMPPFQKIWSPASPYETFCLLVAGCTTDNRFDQICDKVVGEERFKEHFRAWGRRRFDDEVASG